MSSVLPGNTGAIILIFARLPVAGHAKTRLIPALGAQGAARLHRNMLTTTLEQASRSDYANMELWCHPHTGDPYMQSCRRRFRCRLRRQQGDDLGRRMAHAIRHAAADCGLVTLIGSDCPALTSGILNQSLRRLRGGDDLVLGPSRDGGYYLIGMRQPKPQWIDSIFSGIDWGAPDVATRTRDNISRCRLSSTELPTLPDIDTIEDYHRYRRLV